MEQLNLLNIKSYIVGNFRYAIYDSNVRWLLRKHILEQIHWRIDVMNPKCYNNGSCILCGCTTPALQMADKSCDEPCYPGMMNRSSWKAFKEGWTYFEEKSSIQWQIVNKKLIKKGAL